MKDLSVLENVQQFLDTWEGRLSIGEIRKATFLTKSTGEGLRVTLNSTIGLCTYLLCTCGFRYVLTYKMNQDPLERFFGTAHHAGCQNNRPTMPTFLQLYHILSVYKLIKPPKFGNCEVVDNAEKLCFTVNDIEAVFKSDENLGSKVTNLAAKLNDLIETDCWECEDIFLRNDLDPAVIDCIIYFVGGFVVCRSRQKSACSVCREALCTTKAAQQGKISELINAKSRASLTYFSLHLYNIRSAAEEYFVSHTSLPNVYEATLDHVIDTHALTFPCQWQEEELLARVLHYCVSTRTRQFCREENNAAQMASRERKTSSRYFKT